VRLERHILNPLTSERSTTKENRWRKRGEQNF
jgi:hypothetical protein